MTTTTIEQKQAKLRRLEQQVESLTEQREAQVLKREITEQIEDLKLDVECLKSEIAREQELAEEKAYNTEPTGVSAENLAALRNFALAHGIEFTLTDSDIDALWNSQSGKCYLSGIALERTKPVKLDPWEFQRLNLSRDQAKNYSAEQRRGELLHAIIERVNPDSGYTLDNVRLICAVWKGVFNGVPNNTDAYHLHASTLLGRHGKAHRNIKRHQAWKSRSVPYPFQWEVR